MIIFKIQMYNKELYKQNKNHEQRISPFDNIKHFIGKKNACSNLPFQIDYVF